mgnify:CR=1 FL=1
MQEGVVERFATILGCFYEYAQIVHHLALTAEVVKL